MVIDQNKHDRQKKGMSLWIAAIKLSFAKAATLLYPTGFGKTFVAIMVIKDMLSRRPERTTIVVVPTTNLLQAWTGYWSKEEETGKKVWIPGHIDNHGIPKDSIRVFVINTYTTYTNWECDLLILDEAHHYFSYNAKYFSTAISITKYKFGLALSATLNTEQQAFATRVGWGIADVITDTEAESNGWVSPSTTFNLGIRMSDMDREYIEKINTSFKDYFSKFDFQFQIMSACTMGEDKTRIVHDNDGTYLGNKSGKDWRLYWARKKLWDGTAIHPYAPANVMKYAAQGMALMSKRKEALQNMPSKLLSIKGLLSRFHYLNTIVFSQKSDFADRIGAIFPQRTVVYHTNLDTLAVKDNLIVPNPNKEDKKQLRKLGYKIKGLKVRKREAIESFLNDSNEVNVISAVKALDEGTDIPKVDFIIQAAYDSTDRQDTQRNGRGKRLNYEKLSKKALIVNLYMIGTQEEKWLKNKQQGKGLVRWVEDIEQISLNNYINFYAKATTEARDSSSVD